MSGSLRRATTLTSLLLAAACAGSAPGGGMPERDSQVGSDQRMACIVGPAPLTVGDDTFVYIEPEDLIQVESGFVVVGTPTYTWAPGTDGVRFQESANAHVAARFSLDGRATLIAKPIDVAIGTVRTVRLGGERWGVLFDELPPDSINYLSLTRRLWYAEHDGEGWSVVESVPFPESGRPDMSASTDLVRTRDGLTWVVAVRLPLGTTELVEYTRRDGRWTTEVISDTRVQAAALAYSPATGLLLAHFARDSGLPGFQTSVRLFRKSEGRWDLARRLAVAEPGSLMWYLGIALAGEEASVGWFITGPEGASAYVLRSLGPNQDDAPTRLDTSARQFLALGPDGRRTAWLLSHMNAVEGRLDLSLYHPGADVAPSSVAAPRLYPASVAATLIAPSEALVIGVEVSLDPANGYVRSFILRLTTSCT